MIIAILFLTLFAIKHYLADKRFQTHWMVNGKRLPGLAFIYPLAVHASIHATLTFYVVSAVGILLASPAIFWMALPCALFDFVCHFAMDRLKGVMTRPLVKRESDTGWEQLVDYTRSKRWMTAWMIGDQAFHVLTYLAIVAILLI